MGLFVSCWSFCPAIDKDLRIKPLRAARSEALAMEGAAIESQELRGRAPVAAGELEHAFDVAALDGLKVERFGAGATALAAEQRAHEGRFDGALRQRDGAGARHGG